MQGWFHVRMPLARKVRSSSASGTVLLKLHFVKLLIMLLHLIFFIVCVFTGVDVLVLGAEVEGLVLLFLKLFESQNF
jgi:hypothetical protein